MAITDGFKATDPEYAGIVEAFLAEAAGDETQSLPARTRYLAIVAALLGCQGIDAFGAVVPEALEAGVTPVSSRRSCTRRPTIWDSAASCRLWAR